MRKKSPNMLLPWGCAAACDLEKQSRVLGILKVEKEEEEEGKKKKKTD